MTNTLINDTWGQPVLFNAPTEQANRQWPDVSCRFFETRRICFRKIDTFNWLFTNTECLNPDGPSLGGRFPRIAIYRENLIDEFLVFAWQDTVELFQIDP